MAKLKTNFRQLLMKRYGIVEPARLPPQAKIADDIGVWQSTVSLWLNDNVSRFDDDILVKMCTFLRCEVGDLIYIEWNGERKQEPA
jgi:DNA-binding Xre family transcriptional regulator